MAAVVPLDKRTGVNNEGINEVCSAIILICCVVDRHEVLNGATTFF